MFRDCNVRLPWQVLDGLLERIVAVNGSMDRYRKLAASGGIRVHARTPFMQRFPWLQRLLSLAPVWLHAFLY